MTEDGPQTSERPLTGGGTAPSDGAEAQDAVEPQVEVGEEIEHPAKLLRMAGMVQAMLDEVRTVDLDEAARTRLAGIHNRMVEELGDLVSDELRSELNELEVEATDGDPSGAELRIVQAQLAGWLQGLFHGIQASVASQQLAARQQLAQMQQRQLGAGEQRPSRTGQYL